MPERSDHHKSAISYFQSSINIMIPIFLSAYSLNDFKKIFWFIADYWGNPLEQLLALNQSLPPLAAKVL